MTPSGSQAQGAGYGATNIIGECDLADAIWMLLLPPTQVAHFWRMSASAKVSPQAVVLGMFVPCEISPTEVSTFVLTSANVEQARQWTNDLLADGRPIGALYLDVSLPRGILARARSFTYLFPILLTLAKHGLVHTMGYRLLQADGRIYECVPFWRPSQLVATLKGIAALVVNGGRVAICASRESTSTLKSILCAGRLRNGGDAEGVVYVGSGRVLRITTARVVLRIPRGGAALSRCTRAFTALEQAARLGLQLEIPRALKRYSFNGLDVFVESRLAWQGFDYLSMSIRQRSAVRSMALPMIIELHRLSRTTRECDDQTFDALVLHPAERVASAMKGLAVCESLEVFVATAREAMLHRELDLVLAHGDCKIANLLHDGQDKVRGLVDWDRAQLQGFPAVDLLNYAAFDRMLEEGEDFAMALLHCARSMAALPAVQDYRVQMGLDETRWRLCSVMAIIIHAADQFAVLDDQKLQQLPEISTTIDKACRWAVDCANN